MCLGWQQSKNPCLALPNITQQELSKSEDVQAGWLWCVTCVRRDCGDANKRFCLWNCLDWYKTLRIVLPGCRSAWKLLLWQTGQEAWKGRKGFPSRSWIQLESGAGRGRSAAYPDCISNWIQVFSGTKRHKDASGPDPKVLQALPSDSVVKEPELSHGYRTGQNEGSPGCCLNRHWRTLEIAPGFCLLRAGASSWSELCPSFFTWAADLTSAKPDRGSAWLWWDSEHTARSKEELVRRTSLSLFHWRKKQIFLKAAVFP